MAGATNEQDGLLTEIPQPSPPHPVKVTAPMTATATSDRKRSASDGRMRVISIAPDLLLVVGPVIISRGRQQVAPRVQQLRRAVRTKRCVGIVARRSVRV